MTERQTDDRLLTDAELERMFGSDYPDLCEDMKVRDGRDLVVCPPHEKGDATA